MTSVPVDIASSEFLDTPVQCLAALRGQGRTAITTDGWVIVTDFDLARQVLTDPKTYSSHIHKHVSVPGDIADEVAAIRAQGWPYTNALGTSDAPLHTRNRQMVNKAFTPRALTTLEPLVRHAAADLAAALPDGESIDFLTAFGEPLPVWAISKVLGLPPERSTDIRRWSTAAVASIGATPSSEDWLRYEADLLDFQQTMVTVMRENRENGTPGVIAELAQAIDEEDPDSGEGVQVSLLLTLLRELVVAGNETTGKFIAEAVRLVGSDRALWQRLRDDPSHAEFVVEECLRLASPTQSARRVVAVATELDGRQLAPGTIVMVSLAGANRDEHQFAHADVCDPDREGVRSQIAFGQGPHMCIGAGLARLESKIALQVLAQYVDAIDAAGSEAVYTRSYIIRGPVTMPAVVHRRA